MINQDVQIDKNQASQVVLMMKLKIKIKQVEAINSQYSNLPILQEIIHWIKSLVEFKVVFKLDQD
jgi:hypothetical protein